MNLYPIKQKGLVQTALEEDGHKISTLNIEELVPGMYNDVVVRNTNGKHLLSIPDNMDSDRFRFWKRSASGIFSRDFLRFTRNKPSGEYMIVEGKLFKTVVRLIEEEELSEFDGLKLVHGKIKDKHYMHLKTVLNDRNINWNTGYIKSEGELNEFEEATHDALAEEEQPGADEKTTEARPGPLFK